MEEPGAVNSEAYLHDMLMAYLLVIELNLRAWHCGSATVYIRAGTQPAVAHPQHG